MEGTQCKLGTRFTDGLCGDDTDDLSLFDHAAGGKVASVALGAYTVTAFASENAADFHLLDGQGVDKFCFLLADFLPCVQDEFSSERIEYVVHRSTAEDTFAETLYNLILVLDGGCDKSAERTAVFFCNDHVVRHVHQTPCQVTCIGGLEGGIGKTFTCTVRGDEVLEHRHTFLKVGDDRVLDDLCAGCTALLRLGHKASHAAKLLDLLG